MNTHTWWQYFNEHHKVLRDLVTTYHPNTNNKHDMYITAMNAESACTLVREQIQQKTNISITDHFDTAFIEHDLDKMFRLLNETWFGMPESIEVRQEAGFYELCDLCEGPEE